jgi:hypothetical protein
MASEVKQLAAQTAKATGEIAVQIGGMQQATRESASAIEGIARIIDEMGAITTTISQAVDQQGLAGSAIARNIQEAASGTAEASASIGDVSDAARKTGDADDACCPPPATWPAVPISYTARCASSCSRSLTDSAWRGGEEYSPPPLRGGGGVRASIARWVRAAPTLPPAPSLKGRARVFLDQALILTPMGRDPAILKITLSRRPMRHLIPINHGALFIDHSG